ncbi:hypothetical protein GCM10027082_43780 [Comamonas humi]
MKYESKDFAKSAPYSRREYGECGAQAHSAAKGRAHDYKIIDRV